MSQTPQPGSGGPSHKRKRTAQACGPCRTKKTKCDGIHPSCTPCTDLGYTCSYGLDSAPPGQVLVSKTYLEALEHRILRLESSHTGGRGSNDGSRRSRSASPPRRLSASESPFHQHVRSPDRQRRDTMMSTVRPIVDPVPPLQFERGQHGGHGGSDDAAYRTHMGPDMHSPHVPTRLDMAGTPSGMRGQDGPGQGAAASPHDYFSPETNIDGMGLLLVPDRPTPQGAKTIWAASENEVYGETSGISFHRVLLDALLPYRPMDGQPPPPPPDNAREVGSFNNFNGFLGLAPLTDFFVRPEDLPHREEAEQMWDFYAGHTHLVYPFLAIDSLRKGYDALLDAVDNATDGDDPLRVPRNQPIIALYFVVFALVDNLSEIQLTGNDVHRVALRMLRKHIDWPQSTLKVQVLLVGALVMQGVDRPNYGWDLLGYAVRTAYSVGLHDPLTAAGLGPAEREIRLRTWWSAYVFDCIMTLSIARPPAVTTNVQAMPLPSTLPGEPELNVRFFCESIRLHRALSDLISNPLSPRGHGYDLLDRVVSATYRLEKEFAHWADSLPPQLEFGTSTPSNPFAIILNLRALTMRLLLHRRVVLVAIRQHLGVSSDPQSPSGSNAGHRVQNLEEQQRNITVGISLAAVIEAAVLTVELLQKTSDDSLVLSAPWYLLFYGMNAFTSLIATFLLDLAKWSSFIKTPSTVILNSLQSMYTIVEKLHRRYHRPSARQALTIIEQLLASLGLSSAPPQVTSNAVPNPAPAAYPTAPNPGTATMGVGSAGEAVSEAFARLPALPHLDFDELCRTLNINVDDFDFGFGDVACI